MKTIYKHKLEITDVTVIPWRAGAVPLFTGIDPSGDPCIWLQVETEHAVYSRSVFMVGTGNPIPPEASEHIGSFVWGRFVWHIFI